MTMHAAKGLEFPVVFVAGCEEGIVPYVAAADSAGEAADLEEERRLLYVAMTRARDHLFLTSAARRVIFGRSVNPSPSPFLQSWTSPYASSRGISGKRSLRRQVRSKRDFEGQCDPWDGAMRLSLQP
jgi:DNA helicase-2/ATP-dependent DNA helicase PcrA